MRSLRSLPSTPKFTFFIAPHGHSSKKTLFKTRYKSLFFSLLSTGITYKSSKLQIVTEPSIGNIALFGPVTRYFNCREIAFMQRIDVPVDEKFASVLKEYCAYWGMTMGELMYEAAKQHINSSANVCNFADELLAKYELIPDKRLAKHCYGFKCRCCKHQLTCRTGLYKNDWEIADEYKHLLK